MSFDRKVILVFSLILVAVVLFPPFNFTRSDGVTINSGFGFVFSPPLNGMANVNVGQLFAHIIVVIALGFGAWIFFRDKK